MDKNKIILATHNKNKVSEVKEILGDNFDVITMSEVGITEEPVEDGDKIEDNAKIKVNFVKDNLDNTDAIIMADDTGLFVNALDGAPGVYSARYAGENCSYSDNNKKLLKELSDTTDRSAHFNTAIALLFPDGSSDVVVGEVEGDIATELIGTDGFGYDPLFIEKNSGKTYAQMGMDEKNKCSHRSKALELAKKRIDKWLNNEKNRTS